MYKVGDKVKINKDRAEKSRLLEYSKELRETLERNNYIVTIKHKCCDDDGDHDCDSYIFEEIDLVWLGLHIEGPYIEKEIIDPKGQVDSRFEILDI